MDGNGKRIKLFKLLGVRIGECGVGIFRAPTMISAIVLQIPDDAFGGPYGAHSVLPVFTPGFQSRIQF